MENISVIFEQLKPFLAEMSQVLGQGAEFSWAVAMKQQYVTATIGLFWAALGFIGIIGGLISLKTLTKIWDEDNVPEAKGIIIVLLVTLGALSFIPFISGSIVAIQHLVNPEWYAIKDIVSLIKPTIQ